MSEKARELIEFCIDCSSAASRFRAKQTPQDSNDLASGCIKAANGLSISETDLQNEVGDVAVYISGKLPS